MSLVNETFKGVALENPTRALPSTRKPLKRLDLNFMFIISEFDYDKSRASVYSEPCSTIYCFLPARLSPKRMSNI